MAIDPTPLHLPLQGMNYRHAFHAGNHGDVLKHAVLTRVLTYLTRKDAALCVLDTHAGIGHYDFSGAEAFKTGEWRGGIGALMRQQPSADAAVLLAPYLDLVRQMNGSALQFYPGSPEISMRMLRPQDRLQLNELHPLDVQTLQTRYGAAPQVHITSVDAGQAVRASLPFAERRGLVLIDPAFEVTDETARVHAMVQQGLKRMATACFMIWYPVTTQAFADQFCAGFAALQAKSILRAELCVREPAEGAGLAGSGVILINPPFVLHDELATLLPELQEALGVKGESKFQLAWLRGPA